jgi:hypothetical protein
LSGIGKQPISLTLGGRYYAENPAGAHWGMRFVVTFLFPTK